MRRHCGTSIYLKASRQKDIYLQASRRKDILLASFLPEGQGSVFVEPLVRVPYVGTRHLGSQQCLKVFLQYLEILNLIQVFHISFSFEQSSLIC